MAHDRVDPVGDFEAAQIALARLMLERGGHLGRRQLVLLKSNPRNFTVVNHNPDNLSLRRLDKLIAEVAFLRAIATDYVAFKRDYHDLIKSQDNLAASIGLLPHPLNIHPIEVVFVAAETQRLLSNFLSSASAFRDRIKRRYSRRFGKESPETRSLRTMWTAEYDKHFGYRLCHYLRNYAQHNEAPLSTLPVSRERNGQEDVLTVSISIQVSDLLKDEEMKRKIGGELEGLDGRMLDLLEICQVYAQCNDRSFHKLVNRKAEALVAEAQACRSLFGKHEGDDILCTVNLIPKSKAGEYGIYYTHMPFEELDLIRHLCVEASKSIEA